MADTPTTARLIALAQLLDGKVPWPVLNELTDENAGWDFARDSAEFVALATPKAVAALAADLAAALTENERLRGAVEVVMVGLRRGRSNGEYVNRFYGPQIEKLDALLAPVPASEEEPRG